jgi:hypothetical protein
VIPETFNEFATLHRLRFNEVLILTFFLRVENPDTFNFDTTVVDCQRQHDFNL